MTQFWVDVADSAGVKQGLGPIYNVLNWTHTANLDRAGSFSFTMPADDPRRTILRVKRLVRCWTVENGALRQLGAGTINDIALRLDAEGLPVLTVSGDDLLHELTYRNVADLEIVDDAWFHPNEFFLLELAASYLFEDDAASPYSKEEAPAYYTMDLAMDYAPGDTSTRESAAASNTYNRRVVIKGPQQFTEIQFVVNGPAFNPVREAYYWDVAANGGAGDYLSLSFSDDTTMVGGLSWQQNGVMTFSPPATWGIKPGDVGYKICFKNTTYGCPGDIFDIALRGKRPTETVLAPILSYAPAGWTYDTVLGYSEITGYGDYGPNLITNPSFETYTGTQDDAASDTFAGWTTQNIDATGRVEATTDATDGTNAIKIINTNVSSRPRIEQAITVEGDTDYLFECDTRGDGTHDGYYSFTLDGDATNGLRVLSFQWTAISGTSYLHHRQIIHVAPGITTIYLELRGVDIFYTGSAYWDNLQLRKIIGGGDVQLEFANESVLEALIRVTETNGEHFILAPTGRQVLWLRNDVRNTGLRALGNVDPQAVEGESDIALIADLTEQQSAYELVSRVYPFGGGSGAERATLAQCTRAVPTGYTLDTATNCLIRDASETAYGRIDKRLDLPDIVALNQSTAQLENTANMLFDRAYVYLRRHSATNTDLTTGDVPRAYNITLAKCDQVLLPGYLVRVTYQKYFAGVLTISIDRDLWILSSTVRVDESGIQTTALECSTTDTRPQTDALLLADVIRATRAMRAHAPGV